MSHQAVRAYVPTLIAAVLFTAACAENAPLPPNAAPSRAASPLSPLLSFASSGDDDRNDGRGWQFQPLATSTACTNGGNPEKPFALPAGPREKP
jgi:hypothetical protein